MPDPCPSDHDEEQTVATYTELIEALKEPTRALKRAQPDAWKGFGALHQAAMADGEVPARTKELSAAAREAGSVPGAGAGAEWTRTVPLPQV
jgi:hypothetical protein